MKSLACAALNPGLRSLLVFDASYEDLQYLASLLAQLLTVTAERQVQICQLAPFESDDEVWGSVILPEKPPLLRLFSPERNAREFQLIVVPDLAALSQAAARTCTMLVGAEVAHLERHEQHETWQPQYCWLAGCARTDVGKISPHLLDRFALRIQWSDLDPARHLSDEERIVDLLALVPRDAPAMNEVMPVDLLNQLAAASRRYVEIPQNVLAHVMNYFPREQLYPRREITLSRFALALAQLEGSPALGSEHIEEAAELFGLDMQISEDEEAAGEEPEESSLSGHQPDLAEQSPIQSDTPISQVGQEMPRIEQIEIPDTLASPDIEAGVPLSENPYPEDGAFVEREAASLQLPVARFSSSRSAHGPIIGVEESDTLADLAIASTMMSALKFQKFRRSPEQEQRGEIVFKHKDLRRYRRGAALEYLLVMLLDYTSVRDHAGWQDALLPYLGQAYTNRAGVVVVKVGAENAASDLQAEIINARNITVPSIEEALETGSGEASPLAHGLLLAGDRLRHLLQHGRSLAREATFLVLSDGRGNVPREASLKNQLPQRVIGQEGVTDALKEATRVSALLRVESIVLNPQPLYYPELPELLAEALGARIEALSRSDEDTWMETEDVRVEAAL